VRKSNLFRIGFALAAGFTLATLAAAPTKAAAPAGQPMYIANNEIPGAGTVKEYSSTSGTTAGGFTTISSSDPTALAASSSDLYVGDSNTDTVKAYSPTTGAQISAVTFTTITGVIPNALAVTSDGADLFVASNAGTVKEYNASSGAEINTLSVSTSSPVVPLSLALTNNNADIYIGSTNTTTFAGTVAEYAVATGAEVGSFPFSGFYPGGMLVSSDGTHLFVAEEDSNLVTEYNAATGASVPFTLSPAPGEPVNLAGLGNNIFVADDGGISGSGSQVEQYSTTTGTPVSGFTDINGIDPTAIAIIAPEPSSAVLMLGLALPLLLRRRLRANH